MTDHLNNSLVIKTTGGKGSLTECLTRVPKPRSNQASVHVSHVAQNSIDVESLDIGKYGDGNVIGCDFVGEVESVGSHVSKIKKGDVVAGMIWGGEDNGHGAYSKYTLADEDLCFRIPPSINREEAVTVPLAACMAHLGLFSKSCLDMDLKRSPDVSVLIWGGSSCVGRFAIQIATLYKFRVIATCGPGDFDLLKSLGARHVLDYRDKNVITRIKALAPDLEYAFDTLGSSYATAATLSQALVNNGGNLCTIRSDDTYSAEVASRTSLSNVSVWKAFLHDHLYNGVSFAPSIADHELAARLFHFLPNWLKDGIIKPNHPRVLAGGLQKVQFGFEMDRSEGPLDYKIVYEI